MYRLLPNPLHHIPSTRHVLSSSIYIRMVPGLHISPNSLEPDFKLKCITTWLLISALNHTPTLTPASRGHRSWLHQGVNIVELTVLVGMVKRGLLAPSPIRLHLHWIG